MSTPAPLGSAAEPAVFSFDVFDTAITRAVATPAGIFHLAGRMATPRFGFRFVPFHVRRRLAERIARLRSPHAEVTLDEIYREVKWLCGLSSGRAEELKSLEIALERSHVYAVPGVRDAVRAYVAAGRRVVFVSDTYLDEHLVHEQLVRVGYAVAPEQVYVSSRWRETKANGLLFRRVLAAEKTTPERFHHTGDNAISDGSRVAEIGGTATFFEAAALHRAERRSLRAGGKLGRLRHDALGQLAGGAMRKARLCEPAYRESKAFRAGATLTGPVYLPFVCWALAEAMRSGADRVFFLARDGQILHRVAAAIQERAHLPLDLRYLHVSRQALNIATIDIPGSFRDWIFITDLGLTARRLARRLTLEPEAVMDCLREQGIEPKDADTILPPAAVRDLERSFESSRLLQLASSKAAEAREAALRYLTGQGLFEHPRVALVDLGWRGSIQERLQDLGRAVGSPTRFEGFYFAFFAHDPRRRQGKRGFLYTGAVPDWRHFLGNQSLVLFETLAPADHGSTLRYDTFGDETHPVLAPPAIAPAAVRELHDGVVSFVRHFTEEGLRSFVEADAASLRGVAARIAFRLKFFPSREEADFLGEFPVSEQGGTVEGRVAPPLSGLDALATLLSPGNNHPGKRSFWVEASLVRSGSMLGGRAGFLIREAFLLLHRIFFLLPRVLLARARRPVATSA